MKKIFYIVLIFIIVVILLANIVSIFEFSFFGYRLFRVSSGSMEPNLPVNSLIVVKKESNYNVEDIVTYRDSKSYTTHRIVDITDGIVTTKGDANAISDEPISEESIIGKVIFKISLLRFMAEEIIKPKFWIIVFIVGFFIMIRFPISKEVINKICKENRGRRYKRW